MLVLARLVVVLLLTASIVACGGEEVEDSAGDDAETQAPTATITSDTEGVDVTYPPPGILRATYYSNTDWAPPGTLETMAKLHTEIVIARGISVDVGFPYADFIISHFTLPDGKTPPPGDPKADVVPAADRRIGPLMSTYQFEILQVVKSDRLVTGDVISVRQEGGVLDGVLREAEEDPAIELGPTYLMFLDWGADEAYGVAPFGRFEVGADGKFQVAQPEFWGRLPAVQAIVGQSEEEAVRVIQLAMSAAPAISPAEES